MDLKMNAGEVVWSGLSGVRVVMTMRYPVCAEDGGGQPCWGACLPFVLRCRLVLLCRRSTLLPCSAISVLHFCQVRSGQVRLIVNGHS